MNDAFKLGDIATIKLAHQHDQYNGEECTIIGNLKVREVRAFGRIFKATCYRIAIDGKEFVVLPQQLTRRTPSPGRGDMDRVVPWSDCPWRPSEMRP